MIITDYSQFKGFKSIHENVQLAKKYLVDREKGKMGDPSKDLPPEEIHRIQNNRDFIEIRDMLKDNPGYTYAFTKFFFEENVPMADLKNLYKSLREHRQFLNLLSLQPFDKYGNVVPNEKDHRGGYEILIDDIANIEIERAVRYFVSKLPNEFTVTNKNAADRGAVVPSIKKEYFNAPKVIKEKIRNIAIAFDNFGKNPDGSVDLVKKRELQDYFFDKIQRYRNLNEVILNALNAIKSAENGEISKFLQAIQKTNIKYGEMNGAEVVFDENGLLIVEIKSFQANKDLNSNTSHCIASSSGMWDSYVGSENNYNKQYYIYNFNLGNSDPNSIIGVTIEPGHKIKHCHNRPDTEMAGKLKEVLKKWEKEYKINTDLWTLLAPMSDEECEKKRKRIVANREIVKPGISLDDIKKYLLEGADPNAQIGKPLINAVAENDIEKVKFLLDQGAMPNIGGAIRGSKNLDMVKLLVDYGATLTGEIFNSFLISNYEALKYVLEAGVDPNFELGAPLRAAAKIKNKEEAKKVLSLLIEYGADISERRYMAIKWMLEYGNVDLVEFCFDRVAEFNTKIDGNYMDACKVLEWATTSDRIDVKVKDNILNFLKTYKNKKV